MLHDYSKIEKINFIGLTLGKFISVFGSTVYTFVIGLYVLKLTGSGMNFAVTILLGVTALIIFNPIAGMVVDRLNKKLIVILMDCLNGLLFLALFLVGRKYQLSLPMIYISAFLTSALTTVFGIAIGTAIPDMVSRKNLLKINSVSKIIDSVSAIGGPIIAGMVFAFVDIEFFILVNGLSFLISAAFEWMIDFDFNVPKVRESKENTWSARGFKIAFAYIRREKNTVMMFSMFTAVNFFLSLTVTVPMPYIINQSLKLGAFNYGVIQSFFPVGMIIGAVLIKYVIHRFEQVDLLRKSILCLAGMIILTGAPLLIDLAGLEFGKVFALTLYALCMLVFGMVIAFIDIPFIQYLQTEIPRELRGRVLSMAMMWAKLAAPVALILAGIMIDHVNVFIIPLVGGSVLGIGMLVIGRQ